MDAVPPEGTASVFLEMDFRKSRLLRFRHGSASIIGLMVQAFPLGQ